MATKRLKRPRDPIALTKLIGDIATGQTADMTDDCKDAAAALGAKGGKARAAALSKKRRAEIARKAAATSWKKAAT